jgi:hypothetical protein
MGFLAEPLADPCPDLKGSELKECMDEFEEEQEE